MQLLKIIFTIFSTIIILMIKYNLIRIEENIIFIDKSNKESR